MPHRHESCVAHVPLEILIELNDGCRYISRAPIFESRGLVGPPFHNFRSITEIVFFNLAIDLDKSLILCRTKNKYVIFRTITENTQYQYVPRNEAKHVVIGDLDSETEYLIKACTFTESNKSSLYNETQTVTTAPPNAGLADWQIALIGTAAVIVFIGCICFVFFCRG